MNYLIDTHVLLWIGNDNQLISNKIKDIYLSSENEIFFSLASIWEMAIKINLGKLELDFNLSNFIERYVLRNDIQVLKIELSHVLKLEKLPLHHRDPFDRLIIAQAIENNIPVISKDRVFDLYPVKRIW